MEFCKVTLTFESADAILWSDHSNESSLPVLIHGAICSTKISQNEIWTFDQNLLLATFGMTHFQAVSSTVQPCEPRLLSSSFLSRGEEKEALPESRQAFEVTPFFVCKHPFVDKPMVRTEPAEPSARLLQWRTKILGTVMENLPSTSLTFQIFRCSIICTSLTTWIPRMALPSPLQTMLGWTNTFKTGQSVQGCKNDNIAWGRGGRGKS